MGLTAGKGYTYAQEMLLSTIHSHYTFSKDSEWEKNPKKTPKDVASNTPTQGLS